MQICFFETSSVKKSNSHNEKNENKKAPEEGGSDLDKCIGVLFFQGWPRLLAVAEAARWTYANDTSLSISLFYSFPMHSFGGGEEKVGEGGTGLDS